MILQFPIHKLNIIMLLKLWSISQIAPNASRKDDATMIVCPKIILVKALSHTKHPSSLVTSSILLRDFHESLIDFDQTLFNIIC